MKGFVYRFHQLPSRPFDFDQCVFVLFSVSSRVWVTRCTASFVRAIDNEQRGLHVLNTSSLEPTAHSSADTLALNVSEHSGNFLIVSPI